MMPRRKRRTYPYRPDYAVPPGWLLRDYFEAYRLTPARFAGRHSLATDLVAGILAGDAPLDAQFAAILEQEFDLAAQLWLDMEASYRCRLASNAAAEAASGFSEWAKTFPVSELTRRGAIEKPFSPGDAVVKLLNFFGVSSVEEWSSNNADAKVAYRHSPTFVSDEHNLDAWLRLGELESKWQQCAEYDEARFTNALGEIRTLTRRPTAEALDKAIALCNQSGVALALVKPLPRVSLSGATRWLSDKKALIQLSARHKTNDHLWFTLFHEAAHILLHSRDCVFIDNPKDEIAGVDAEADRWASEFLIPRREWDEFVSGGHFGEWAVRSFAHNQGIAPAIVVGRLQHERKIPWSRLNHLKARMRWPEPES